MNDMMRNSETSIRIPCKDKELNGIYYVPQEAKGIILFVHGNGSSRFSFRNQYVAHALNAANYATLLFDLLGEFRFDTELLASRLIEVTHWCVKVMAGGPLNIGYFGSSTGGGAALMAAAQAPTLIRVVVSRGGRPDLVVWFELSMELNLKTILCSISGYAYNIKSL